MENSFFEKVYQVVIKVPFGRVTTYGAIAKYLGTARSSRMVGWAMNNSSNYHIEVPAHRVVNRLGLLSGKGHFHGPKVMQELLENEGIAIKKDQVQNMNEFFWDPATELD